MQEEAPTAAAADGAPLLLAAETGRIIQRAIKAKA